MGEDEGSRLEWQDANAVILTSERLEPLATHSPTRWQSPPCLLNPKIHQRIEAM